jgi:hypothetical protein
MKGCQANEARKTNSHTEIEPRLYADERVHRGNPGSARGRRQPTWRRGIVPVPLLAELIARGAKLRPVVAPKPEPEPRYRPCTALDEFVRTRDLTCRAVGCDRRAMHADIDHTVPYHAGATHPGNLKCYCRIQMTRKTL